MKLTLEHLAPYLPYGLKCKCDYGNDTLDSFTFVLDRLDTGDGIYAAYEWYAPENGYIKPILRPLSDLTREIEVNGERIVPILELARLVNPKFGYNTDSDRPLSFKKTSVSYCYDDVSYEFSYVNGDFVMLQFWKQESRRYVNQYPLFQKLAEWHFDFAFNLIESGLAVDINQIEK